VVVYTGLIRAAQTPEELASVLAHEMAHVTRRHGMQRIAQSLGVIAGIQLLFGDVSGVAAVAVEVLREGAINSYSRDHEHEDDMDAVHTLARAGINPSALADFFVLLEKRDGNLPSLVAWLGTHPELSQRIADVRKAAARAGSVTVKPLLENWSEVQRHAGRMP
jgi:predicted Zn-dependent protease